MGNVKGILTDADKSHRSRSVDVLWLSLYLATSDTEQMSIVIHHCAATLATDRVPIPMLTTILHCGLYDAIKSFPKWCTACKYRAVNILCRYCKTRIEFINGGGGGRVAEALVTFVKVKLPVPKHHPV
jgi:hypothetical protein